MSHPRLARSAVACMAVLFVLVALCGLFGCVSIKGEPGVIRSTKEQLAQCDAEGGCSVYTLKALQTLALVGIQTGVESCRKDGTI